jgi:hypothetical protein
MGSRWDRLARGNGRDGKCEEEAVMGGVRVADNVVCRSQRSAYVGVVTGRSHPGLRLGAFSV